MRKFFFPLAAALVLIALISCAGNPVEDKSAVETAEVVQASPVGSEPTVTIWKPLELISSYIDGTVDKTVTYSYSDDGRLLKSIDKDGRGNLLLEKAFEYENGYLVKETSSGLSGPISMTLYNLNKDHLVDEQIKKDPQGTILTVVQFEYDGQLVKRATASNGSGIPLLITEYQYQDEQIVSVLYKTASGSEEARFERILENGVIVREQTVLPDGSIETAREFLYEGGMNFKTVHYTGDSKAKTTMLEHDDYGNIILEVWSDQSGREYSVIERSWIQFEDIK